MDPIVILIFDSYDCTGKTAYVKHFAEHYNFKAFSDGNAVPRENVEVHREVTYNNLRYFIKHAQLFRPQRNIVLDRFAQTEAVYSPIKRGYDFTERYQELEQMIGESEAYGIYYFWVMPYVEYEAELKRRYTESREDFVSWDQLMEVKKGYEELYDNGHYGSGMDATKIRTDSFGDLEKNCELIIARGVLVGPERKYWIK